MAKLNLIYVVDVDSIPLKKDRTGYKWNLLDSTSQTLVAAGNYIDTHHFKQAVILEYGTSNILASPVTARSFTRKDEYYLSLKMIDSERALILDSDEPELIGCFCEIESGRLFQTILSNKSLWTSDDKTSVTIVENDNVYITGYFSITVTGSYYRRSYFELIKRKE